MRHVLVMLVGLCVSCGPGLGDFAGGYEGKATITEKEGMLRYEREVPSYLVYITPADSGEQVVIQISNGCAVLATWEGEDLTLASSSCRDGGSSTYKQVDVTGSGKWSEESLTLNWTMKGTLYRGNQTLDYEGTYAFVGKPTTGGQ